MGCSHTHKRPVVFDEFFQMGLQDDSSPFLTKKSREWAKNLHLKTSFLATFLLIGSFFLTFFPSFQSMSSLFLVGVYFFAGLPSLIDSIEDIGRLEINIDVLMTLAAFSSVLIGSPMEGGLLLVLFSLSEAMEEAVEAKAKGAISSLYQLSPTQAFVIETNGSIVKRAVNDIRVGTKILVKSGEIVPLDGIVINGASSVSLVHLTGENLPVTKAIDDTVPAGGQNLEGSLTLEVTHTSADSTLSRIIQLVTQAQEAKPRLQRWFDSVSKRYATTIIGLSFLFALSFPFLFGLPFLGIEGSFYRAIAFLIAASPCALIIATPIAYLSALSTCARKGILLKGGITLDALTECQTIAFDKTGTLTTGELRCVGIDSILNTTSDDAKLALAIGNSLETHAVHPIAHSIVAQAEKEQSPTISLSEFKNIAGYGVQAIVELPSGEQAESFLGNLEFITKKLSKEHNTLLQTAVNQAQKRGFLIAILLFQQNIFLFRFEDTIRPKIKETLEELKQTGKWDLLMLTGDHKENADRIAKELPLNAVYANLRPEDKLRHVSTLSKIKGLVMVGDGINDAPALARATVGISMGKAGSSTAIEAADVVLLHDNLELLGWLMRKAHQTKRVVSENLILASGVILLATTPALFGWVPLWVAVVLHEGGTVLVGLNALRLLERKN